MSLACTWTIQTNVEVFMSLFVTISLLIIMFLLVIKCYTEGLLLINNDYKHFDKKGKIIDEHLNMMMVVVVVMMMMLLMMIMLSCFREVWECAAGWLYCVLFQETYIQNSQEVIIIGETSCCDIWRTSAWWAMDILLWNYSGTPLNPT